MNLPICTGSNRKIKYGICFTFLIVLLVIFFTVSVCVGSVNISLAEILSQFTGEQDELYATVLFGNPDSADGRSGVIRRFVIVVRIFASDVFP